MKCLLVDDLEDNLLVLSALLGGQDVQLLLARSGREALELLLTNEVALALVDVQMPEMDGFELAELMRGAERTRNVPIIFVTAGNRDQQRVFKGYDLGAVDFLFKPVEPHILQSKTKVFFELHRQRQLLNKQLTERTETLRTNEMFMAILSHDLRNPLNSMLAGAELVRRLSSDEKALRAVERILRSGQRMADIISSMLDLTRARLGGGIALALAPCDLSEVAKQVVTEHQPEPPHPGITLHQEGDLNGVWDRGRLAQVLSNLIGNALSHGLPSEAVRIQLDGQAADRVRLRVSNAGAMPESIRARVFDPFSRAAERHGTDKGLGLGLYIVEQVVLAHGGSVGIVDDVAGQTTFAVELPRQASANQPHAAH